MHLEALLRTLRVRRRLPAAQLLAALGVSRPTLMRAVHAAGEQVLTIGRARRTSYAARRPLRGRWAPLPVFRIDPQGRPAAVGELHLAHPGGSLLRGAILEGWPLEGDMRDGWFDGVPYMLQDLRPEGFLGRAFARAHASLLQVGDAPRAWSDDDALYALSLLGADQPGCFIVGDAAYRRWLEQADAGTVPIGDAEIQARYPERARHALQGGTAGSSAGGEFPKFTAARTLGGETAQVIVKFSGNDDTPGTRRWQDLLVCEHLAARVVPTIEGLRSPHTTIHQADARSFLEVVRFDRQGAQGRSPVCSWAALNGAWFGLGGKPWTDAATRLHASGLIDEATRSAIVRLWHFGQLIANSDMHDGNLAFVPTGAGFELAPVYDMLPMAYAPQRGVELTGRDFAPRLPLPSEREAWLQAAAAATGFWNQAAADPRIGAAFRQVCADNAARVQAARRTVSDWA